MDPEYLSPEKARDGWERSLIEFYNNGKIPPEKFEEIGLPGCFVGRSGLELLNDIHPSSAKLVQGLEMELLAVFPRHEGFLVATQSLRNPEYHSRIISPLAEPSPEDVLQRLETPFAVATKEGIEDLVFPVAIPEQWTLRQLFQGAYAYRQRHRSSGIIVKEEELPMFQALAELSWTS